MRLRLIVVSLCLILLSISVPLSTAQEDRLQIVASHSILADVVENVVGEVADVVSTMPVGADPHSFVPVPRDLITLAEADVVFINGAFFEEGLLESIENAGVDMNVVTASSCVSVIAFGDEDHDHGDEDHHDENDHSDEEHHDDDDHGDEEHHEDDPAEDHHTEAEGTETGLASLCEAHRAELNTADSNYNTIGMLYEVECGGDTHDHDEHDSGEDRDHTEEAHDHGICDPHVWMDPANVMYWTLMIRDNVVELDPANADVYTANAQAYLEELDALVSDFMTPVVASVPDDNRTLVTNHDSLGYFAARNGFEIVGTIIPGGATLDDPSATDIAELITLIRDEAVPAIFAETTISDRVVRQIADESGVEVAVLFSGSLSDADGPASTYIDYMRYNITTVIEALGGSIGS